MPFLFRPDDKPLSSSSSSLSASQTPQITLFNIAESITANPNDFHAAVKSGPGNKSGVGLLGVVKTGRHNGLTLDRYFGCYRFSCSGQGGSESESSVFRLSGYLSPVTKSARTLSATARAASVSRIPLVSTSSMPLLVCLEIASWNNSRAS